MANKRQLIFKVVDFFNEKGKILSLAEYRAYGNEVPVKDYHIRRYWGSWNRVTQAANKLVEEGTITLNPTKEFDWRQEPEEFLFENKEVGNPFNG